LLGFQVPDLHGPLKAAGGQTPSIRTESDADDSRMTMDREAMLTRGRVPENDRATEFARHQSPAITAENYFFDESAVVRDCIDLLTGGHVPKGDGLTACGRCQPLAVR